MLCGSCLLLGYCRRLQSRKVTDAEIKNKQFVLHLKRHARSLNVTFDSWADYLLDQYTWYPGRIVDHSGAETYLSIEELFFDSHKYWFREFIGKDPAPVTFSHIRWEAQERVIVMASILRAVSPVLAINWGRVVANDVDPVPLANPRNWSGDCPHRKLLMR